MNWFPWILAIGGGLAVPACMSWYRRRCLADPRFPKGTDGNGLFAGETIDEADRARLMGWQRTMVTAFVACMVVVVLVPVADLVLGLSRLFETRSFFALLLLLVAIPLYVLLSAKCPRCGYRLGLQTGLLLPRSCERCGVSLRDHRGEPAG